MPLPDLAEIKINSNKKLAYDKQDFINEVETLHQVDKLKYKEIAKLYKITDRRLRQIRNEGGNPSKQLLDRGHISFIKELPINYVAYIRRVISEGGNYYVVEILRIRSLRGATIRLDELEHYEYQDSFVDGTISDYKPDIINKLIQWMNRYDKDISNLSTVKMWINRQNF